MRVEVQLGEYISNEEDSPGDLEVEVFTRNLVNGIPKKLQFFKLESYDV